MFVVTFGLRTCAIICLDALPDAITSQSAAYRLDAQMGRSRAVVSLGTCSLHHAVASHSSILELHNARFKTFIISMFDVEQDSSVHINVKCTPGVLTVSITRHGQIALLLDSGC